MNRYRVANHIRGIPIIGGGKEFYVADDVDKKLKGLRMALKEYGGHRQSCDLLQTQLDQRYPNVPKFCTCGFEQALKM